MPTVTVRLFAVLREIAGVSEAEAEGETVEEVVQKLCDLHGERFTAIVRVSSVVLCDERLSLEHALNDGDKLALLPPVSGG